MISGELSAVQVNEIYHYVFSYNREKVKFCTFPYPPSLLCVPLDACICICKYSETLYCEHH